jgi:hypothetical protein
MTTIPAACIIARLTEPAALRYFGKTFALRVEVLAALETGRSFADIAREYRVSRQAVAKLAAAARRAYVTTAS